MKTNFAKARIILPLALCFAFCQAMSLDSGTTEGPGHYEIINGKTDPIRIPFTMHNNKPLLQVEINGHNGTLMIDNGVLWDQVWLFGSPLVSELNLIPAGEITIGGAGEEEPTTAYAAENITLKFDDVIFHEQPLLVSMPSAGIANLFPGVDGQLCNTFFKHFIVEFDFIDNLVILHRPDQYRPAPHGCVIEMKTEESGTHSIPFTFEMPDGKIFSERVDVDFGGSDPLKIALNNKHNIVLPDDAIKKTSYGAQGKITEYSGRINSMTIGKYKFLYPPVAFADAETSYIHRDNLGVVGLALFIRFNIAFDYINNKIYIEPNENFAKPFDI